MNAIAAATILIFAGVMSSSDPITAMLDADQMGTEMLGSELDGLTFSCVKRLYSFQVSQQDSEGRSCWDTVNVVSCWGKCDSSEVMLALRTQTLELIFWVNFRDIFFQFHFKIGDWRFPFKRSRHPVCMHDEIQLQQHILNNCDPDVEPGTEVYTAIEAVSCKCQICKPETSACQGLQYRGTRSSLHF